ncbi:hypothetical protein AXF42_Ash004352 [Apostasia shenzhenica]|uniref:Uncharacterized protein n=1 Tax=Apostasia shenzhenica TaxID=1088818 RepID=A0A2I0A2N4_9ASPA|nr:hypothetical protein AXF42_Ash004352 [Apostasia shenzhenica]
MLQPSQIPRRNTSIKRYHPPCTDAGLSGGRQKARTQSLSITFSLENQGEATHSNSYKYRGTVHQKGGYTGKDQRTIGIEIA